MRPLLYYTAGHLVQCLSNNLQESQQPEKSAPVFFRNLAYHLKAFPLHIPIPFPISIAMQGLYGIFAFA